MSSVIVSAHPSQSSQHSVDVHMHHRSFGGGAIPGVLDETASQEGIIKESDAEHSSTHSPAVSSTSLKSNEIEKDDSCGEDVQDAQPQESDDNEREDCAGISTESQALISLPCNAILSVPELKERFMALYKETLKTSSSSVREEMPMVVSEIERGQTVVDAVLEFFASHEKVSSRCEQETALQSLLSILKHGDVRVLDDIKKLEPTATILEQSAGTEQVVEMLDFLATHCTLFSPKDQGTPERPTRASRALEVSFSREEVAKDGISSQGAEPGKAYPSPRSFASNGAAAKDAWADQDAMQNIQDTEGKTTEDHPVSRLANTAEVDKGEADGQGSHGVKDARTSAMVVETDAVGVSAENAKGGSVPASATLFVPEGDISAAQMELGAAREVPPGGAYPALATVVKKAARTADSINECVTEIQIKKRRLIDSAQRMRDLEDGRRRAEEALQRELEAEAQERAAVTVAAENLEKAENELRAARIRLQNGDRQRAICRSVAEDAREQSRQAKLAVKVEKADLSALMDRLPK